MTANFSIFYLMVMYICMIIAVIEPRSRTMKSGFHNKNLISSLLSADFVIWFEDSELNWSIENSLGEMTDKIFIEKSILGILTTLNRIKEQIANIVIMSNGDFSGFVTNMIDQVIKPETNFTFGKDSINYSEYAIFEGDLRYFKTFNDSPSEMTILAYDAVGLIYYAWKKNGKINTVNDFSFKRKIKGKIGTFSFENKKIIQNLNIYKAENKKFIKF